MSTTTTTTTATALKLCYKGEWRRMSLGQEPAPTDVCSCVASLRTCVAKVFSLSDNDFHLRYKDEDGDWVTVITDAELACAVASMSGGVARFMVAPAHQQDGDDDEASSPATHTLPPHRWGRGGGRAHGRGHHHHHRHPYFQRRHQAHEQHGSEPTTCEGRGGRGPPMWLRRRLWNGRWPGHDHGAPSPDGWGPVAKDGDADQGVDAQGDDEGATCSSDASTSTDTAGDTASTSTLSLLMQQQRAELATLRQDFHARKAAIRAKYCAPLRAARLAAKKQQGGGGGPGNRAGRGGGRCKRALVARFVRHVTMEDDSRVSPKQGFVKTWRFRNDGSEAWPRACVLRYIGKAGKSDAMTDATEVAVNADHDVTPGQEVDASVPMVAPAEEGRYVGFWKMCTPDGRKFGQRVWVRVQVCAPDASSKQQQQQQQQQHEATPMQWATQLASLHSMGFLDDERNVALLQQHDGVLVHVVTALLGRMV